MNSSPIFIVGTPRSGTTLLAAMLGAHSRLDCGPETHFFRYLSGFKVDELISYRKWPTRALELIRSMEVHEEKVYKNFGLRIEDIEEFLRGQQPSIRAILESLTVLHARQMGKARWVEKTPNHLLFLAEIREHFHDSPIIYIVRDLRDVASSMRKLPWASNLVLPNLLLAKEWQKQASELVNLDEKLIVVRYEDLIYDTPMTLDKICDFIGEEFEPQMLFPGENAKLLIGKGEWWKQQVTGPLDRSRCYVWKREMPKEYARTLTFLAYKELKRYGYSVDEEPVGDVALFPASLRFIEKNEEIFLRFGIDRLGCKVCVNFIDLMGQIRNPRTLGVVILDFPEHIGLRLENMPMKLTIRLVFLFISFLLCRIKRKKLVWVRDSGEGMYRYLKIKNTFEKILGQFLGVKPVERLEAFWE